MSPKRGAGAAVGVGMLRGRGDQFLGLLVSWFSCLCSVVYVCFPIFVCCVCRFVVSWFLGLEVSKFQSFKVSKSQSFKDSNVLLEDLDPI